MLFRSSLVAALSASFLQSAAAEITTDVVGKSGKIKIFDSAGIREDRNAIMMTMDFLYELDADEKIVGNQGSQKHGTQTFANQQFTFSDVEEVTYSNVTADYFSFEAKVYEAGSIKVETYVFREDGVITTSAEETFDVFAGDFKFSIELIDWKWCNPCDSNEYGAFVDVGIELKGSKAEPSEEDLGGGIPVILSSKILADNVVIDMPAGYPKIVSKDAYDLDGDGVEDGDGDGKKLFIFRFPKEGDATLYDYDPIIRTSGDTCGIFCRALPCL
ncbi:hypothetical protein FisN_2Hh319 [Fistulifera solaris]|jgi:hypothetical protein|uniref:Uncharacterized protein n=1 Tax=Fistulifera solaris TaxID=1519565 RepID=A0A1Z5KKY1_FISSO|nr:hypothetical protein FisN_2Hh319 [Fistulifera solaris]|eukprot:GAX26732.1 hypothetical protein FisN_2Hh319 [Fistulifera solaris]